MGGIFSTPDPAPLPPEPDTPDPAIAEREARLERLERARRGRRGTIATADRGLLTLRNLSSERRSLLGE